MEMKRKTIILSALFAISLTGNSYSQNSRKDTLESNPQFGVFIGGGYDYFTEGSKYDQDGAGSITQTVDYNKTKGGAAIIGLQFKIPFKETFLLSLEGSGVVSSHQIKYVLSSDRGALTNGGSVLLSDDSKTYSDYTTNYFSTRFSGIIEKRFGKNWNYYFGIGPYGSTNYRKINAKGTEYTDSFYIDTTIYDNNIRTYYQTEFGLTMLTGIIIPASTKTKLFIEARGLVPFRDSIKNPNLKIYHFLINLGLFWNINF